MEGEHLWMLSLLLFPHALLNDMFSQAITGIWSQNYFFFFLSGVPLSGLQIKMGDEEEDDIGLMPYFT